MLSDCTRSASSFTLAGVLLLEHWKPVVGYECLYQVSNIGRVWINAKQRCLSQRQDKDDYPFVNLSKNDNKQRAKVHRLVGDAFLGVLPMGLETNHITGYKRQNWVSKLEYITPAQNKFHAMKYGLLPRKLSPHDVQAIKKW